MRPGPNKGSMNECSVSDVYIYGSFGMIFFILVTLSVADVNGDCNVLDRRKEG